MVASVEIAGIACEVPERVVTNFELEELVETSDEWITKRTGIRRRHLSTGERSVDMALEAAKKAIENSGVDKSDIGLIISSSITSEYITPSMSSYVQKALDIDDCANMDISAGCSGFVYALSTAASLMDTLGKDAALVISSEAISQYVDWSERSTCVLFGDGAGAVVLKKSPEPKVHFPILSGSPDKEDVIICRRELRKTPFNSPGEQDMKQDHLHMNGREVFTYAVSAADTVLHKLLAMCKDKPFTKVIPHQANGKIIDYVKRKLRFKSEQFFLDIDEYANTSSATIPIAMYDAYTKGWLKKGDRVALVAFGSGLTCGGVVVDWTI